MGNFNPHRPEILGMEWVPLSQRLRTLDVGTEIGYSFTVTGAPHNAIDTVSTLPGTAQAPVDLSTVFYSIYSEGNEDQTGEIRVIRLRPASAGVTGAAVIGGGTATSALTYSSDAEYIQFDAASDRASVKFSIPAVLDDKRILGIDFVYSAFGTPGFALYPTIESPAVAWPYSTFSGPPQLAGAMESSFSIGEVNPWSLFVTSGLSPQSTAVRLPWRYEDLQALATTGALSLGIRVDSLPLSGNANLALVALDVYYCTENRVAYGGAAVGDDPESVFAAVSYVDTLGASIFTANTFASGVTLAAGRYTLTMTQADGGSRYNAGSIRFPELTQKDEIPTHPLVSVTKFKRPSGVLRTVPPVAASVDTLVASVPNLSGTALQFGMAPVSYTTMVGAPVYGAVTAVQQIHNVASASDTSYEWVRFYARRFNPAAPGDLTVAVAGSGSATITATEFAALDELTIGEYGAGTGWKEVTLPITAVFSSDGTFRNVTFSMSGSTAIQEQYQIVTATADSPIPALGISLPSYAKSIYDGLQNATATYDTVLNGVATSTTSTVAVMFSQAGPAVTGFAVTGTGCALDVTPTQLGCEPGPGCVPTHILGNGMSWVPLSSTSPAVTGGTIEIQRMDEIDDTWQTVAEIPFSSSPSSFCDYEARAGVTSWYRIRTVNLLDFAGPWVTGSGLLASPAVSGVGDGNSVLIFTSNRNPDASLAYVMQFGDSPEEQFGFPESGFQQLRTQYQKNYFTAFRPTERGGETFTRDILVHNAAVPAPSLGNFRSLRDLAWSSLPYVCVRDELGNRWLANVAVPGGRVRNNREVYIAQVQVTEVTDTPAPYEGA